MRRTAPLPGSVGAAVTPARGLVLIRRPDLSDSVNGVVLLDGTARAWTQGQAEILSVGKDAWVSDVYPDPDDYDGTGDTIPTDSRLVPGTWVLTRFRTWMPADQEGTYLVRTADILAVIDAAL